MEKGNVLLPEVYFNTNEEQYIISWLSEVNGTQKVYKTTTTDFKIYSKTVEDSKEDRINNRTERIIDGEKQTGIVSKVSWETIEGLIK